MKLLNIIFIVLLLLSGNGTVAYAQEFNSAQLPYIENILSNPGFEGGISRVKVYNDSSSVPVDGTGGVTTGVTLSFLTPAIGQGARSLRISKDAANRQGLGVALYDFTIPSGLKTKIHTVEFEYSSSENYLDADVRIYAIDLTTPANAPIEVNDRDINANTFGRFLGTFQANSTATSYRLVAHVASTNPLLWTLDIDDVSISSRKKSVKGTVGTDWIAFTPTGSMTTNTTYTGRYKRAGDSADIEVLVSFAGAPTATSLTVNNPSGLVIDTTKLNDTTVNVGGIPKATAILYDASAVASGRILGNVYYNNATRVTVGFIEDSNTTEHQLNQFTSTVPITVASGDKLFMSYTIPIAGWSSNMTLSEDGGTRKIYTSATMSGNQNIVTTGATKVTFDTAPHDYTSSFVVASNSIQVPESGEYDLDVSVYLTGLTIDTQGAVSIYVNGSSLVQRDFTASATSVQYPVNTMLPLIKGDLVDVRVSSADGNYTVNSATARNWFKISKRSSPQTHAGGSTYSASFTSTSGQSIPDITATTVNWPAQVFNDGLGTMSSGVFTFSVSGTMQVCTNVSLGNMSTFNGTGERQILYIFYDTDYVARIQSVPPSSANPTGATLCSPPFRASRGKSMIIQYYQESGGALSLTTTSWLNNLGITRVGN